MSLVWIIVLGTQQSDAFVKMLFDFDDVPTVDNNSSTCLGNINIPA